MDLQLKGKRALVMGSSTGIGRGIAESLAAEGARVALCARDAAKLEAARRGMGAELGIACDLSRPGAGAKLVRDAMAGLGGLDILVTNTGGPPKGKFAELDAEDWLEGFQGLWLSAADAIREALPGMTAQGFGRILLVTSISAKEPLAGLTVSNGLRAGLLNLAKSLSVEVAAQGVTVNAILPGYTRTERLRELGVAEADLSSRVPSRRLAEPSEIGALAAFLASARAGYITGQAIAVDGGYLKGIF